MLDAARWRVEAWAGIRLFSDIAPDDLDADAYPALLDLELAAGTLDPYRRIVRLVHLLSRAVSTRGRTSAPGGHGLAGRR